MDEKYVLSVKTNEGRVVMKSGASCHATKSLAGSLFHSPRVKSVFVGDILGNHYLYLVKGDPAKTENVSSTLATYG